LRGIAGGWYRAVSRLVAVHKGEKPSKSVNSIAIILIKEAISEITGFEISVSGDHTCKGL
jgi:hypothetical protein